MAMAMAKRDRKYCSGPQVEECIIYRRSQSIIILEVQIRPWPPRSACDRPHPWSIFRYRTPHHASKCSPAV